MKAKVGKRGAGFSGLLRYVHDSGLTSGGTKNARRIGGNMDGSLPLSKQASQLRKIAQIRSDIERPVLHFSLSAPEWEKLSDEKWCEVAADFLRAMDIGKEHQWLVAIHPGKFEHIHIVANRISIGGKVWDTRNDVYKALAATQEIERKHGLTITEAFDKLAPARALKSGEIQQAKRTDKTPPRLKIRLAIDAAKESCKSLDEFVSKLKKVDIEMLPNGLSGAVSGVSFMADGIVFKGSEIGPDYKWSSLAKAFHFDPVNDAQTIQSLRANAPIRLQDLTNSPSIQKSKNERFRLEKDEDKEEINEAKKRKKAASNLRLRDTNANPKINEFLGGRCREITEFETHTEIFLTGGGAIHDFGNQLRCYGGDKEIVGVIDAAVDLALARSWVTFKIKGPDKFVRQVALSALRKGFKPEQLKVNFWQKAVLKNAVNEFEKECRNVTGKKFGAESADGNDQPVASASRSASNLASAKESDAPHLNESCDSLEVEIKNENVNGFNADVDGRFLGDVERDHVGRVGDVLKKASSSHGSRFR